MPPANHDEMKRLIAEFDWASTPVGPMHEWPACLRCAVDIVTIHRLVFILVRLQLIFSR
jgi:hypothetical protein